MGMEHTIGIAIGIAIAIEMFWLSNPIPIPIATGIAMLFWIFDGVARPGLW